MRLYFLRHGESEANLNNIMTGQLDVPLTDRGREQAIAAGDSINELGIHIDAIVASPLIRARETARLVAETIGFDDTAVVAKPLIMERYFGTLEGKTKDDEDPYTEEMITAAGAETEESVMERAEEFLIYVKTIPAETVLVVSHTGYGRRLRAAIDGVSADEAAGFNNAELTDLGEI